LHKTLGIEVADAATQTDTAHHQNPLHLGQYFGALIDRNPVLTGVSAQLLYQWTWYQAATKCLHI
jgi:hypothetical protein